MEIKWHSPEQLMIKEEIKQKYKIIFTDENGNTIYQKWWDTANAIQRGNLTNAYIKKAREVSNKEPSSML